MNKKLLSFSLLILAVATLSAFAADDDSDALWGWSISGGGNFGFGLKTNLRTSNRAALQAMPRASSTVDKKVYDPTRANKFERVDYTGGPVAFVDPESEASIGDPNETINWGLPVDTSDPYSLKGVNPYVSVTETLNRDISSRDEAVAYGASVDLSHALWVSEDGAWGVDIAFGLTWMRANDCYRNRNGLTYSQDVEEGDFVTSFRNAWIESGFFSPNDDNTWGGAAPTQYEAWNNGKMPTPLDMTTATYDYNPDGTKSRTESLYLNSHGDYEEWEISILLKPWYDINDWLCVHGAVGMGVTRSSFDYSMEAIFNGSTVYRSSEEFDEWRCYGLAGAGLLLRAWDFDFSCDGIFRWCQQDMDINGRDVQGTLEKPWGVLRLGLSYAF